MKLRLISLGLISHLCPGFHAITNFTILRSKISAAMIFCTLRLSIQTLQKLRKIGTTTIFCNLLFLFPYWLVSLPRRRFLIQQILRDWRKIVVDLSNLTNFRYCFVLFSLTRGGLRIQPVPQKVPKLVRFLNFLFVLTCSSLTKTTDVNFPG